MPQQRHMIMPATLRYIISETESTYSLVGTTVDISINYLPRRNFQYMRKKLYLFSIYAQIPFHFMSELYA